MQDRTLLRIGAVSLIAGVVFFFIFLALLTAVEQGNPGDVEGHLQSIVGSSIWAGFHDVFLAALLLFVGGLLALHRSITGEEAGAALARLGFTAALLGSALFFVSEGIYGGSAMKELADTWAAAADKTVPFAVAEAMVLVSFDIFSWGIVVFYGVAPLLFGLAIVLTDIYPTWLGWVAAVGGAGNALIGIVLFYQGWSPATSNTWGPFAILITLWLLVMGVLMWRKAGTAVNP